MMKKWITDNLSDFTSKIENSDDYETLIKNPKDQDINKVLLFTKKAETTPAAKALSAEFRNKIRFTIVPLPDGGKASQNNIQLQLDYEISTLPKLVLEQTYNPKTDQLLENSMIHEYKKDGFKLNQLIEFLKPYARATPKEDLDDIVEQKENQKAKSESKTTKTQESVDEWHFNVNEANFTSEVLGSDEAHLVYFTLLPANKKVTDEYKFFNKLTRTLSGPVKVSVFRLNPSAANFNDLKKQFKVTTVDTEKPKLRYFPNKATGESKMSKSYGITLDT